MNDKKFDKIIKSKVQQEQDIPYEINSLFSNFERRIIMEGKERKKAGIIKYVATAVATLTILSGGGCVFAHVNGIETIISPLLRNLGINSKYEEERIEINNSTFSNNVDVKLLDAAIDDASLIVGYEININDDNIDNWIDVHGEYKLNELSIKPISTSIDKTESGAYVLYQLFDINEIDLKDKTDFPLYFNITNISTYTEYEDASGSYAKYNNSIDGDWEFYRTISITNKQKTKEYTLNGETIDVLDNVKITADRLVVGAYTNVLKIKTNQENYKGDSFETYYRIFDQNNEEIVTGSETREYEYRIYNDRLSLGDIDLNQKINIQVYLKVVGEEGFQNVGNIKVDLSKKKEVVEEIFENYKTFDGKEYSFEYNSDWKNIVIATKEMVGPNSRYLNSLQVEIPSTTNSESNSSISILSNKGTTLTKYVGKIKKDYLNSTEGSGYTQKEERAYNTNSMSGRKIIFETTDGEEVFVDVKYIFENNNTVYEVDYFGTEIEYNNLEKEIERLVDSFEIKK